MNPHFFMLGCPRSGTRLLGRVVNVHPEIAVIHEARFVPGWFAHRRGLTPEGLVTRELVERLAEFPRFKQLDVRREQLEAIAEPDGTVPYSTFITKLFDLHGKAQGKRLVGDKTPRYVRHIPTLHRLFPSARIIHLIRDGRDVFLSLSNWRKVVERGEMVASLPTWQDDRAATAALWWEGLVRRGREDGLALGPRLYRESRYEQLVADPAAECAALCTFLDVPYDEAMPNFHEHVDPSRPGQDARPATAGLRDWSTQMRPDDVERFEAAAGDLLDELGYPRAFPQVSSKMREHAARVRETFTAHVESRGGRLPKRW